MEKIKLPVRAACYPDTKVPYVEDSDYTLLAETVTISQALTVAALLSAAPRLLALVESVGGVCPLNGGVETLAEEHEEAVRILAQLDAGVADV